MIKIAICDDQKEFLNKIEEMIYRYAAEHELALTVKSFAGALPLLVSLEQGFRIFFLDIQMPHMDGMEIAEIIRNKDEFAYIVFITSTDKYVFDGYKVGAGNYIKKPISYQILSLEIENALSYISKHSEKFLLIHNNEGLHKIYITAIVYIETYNRNTLIHTDTNEIISFKKMQEYEDELKDYPFYRCHNSYIINLDYISNVKLLEISLLTGEKIPLSKQRRKKLVQLCASYLGSGRL